MDADTDGKGADRSELLVPWAEVEVASLLAELAAAAARYRVIVTLTFVPPDPPEDRDG